MNSLSYQSTDGVIAGVTPNMNKWVKTGYNGGNRPTNPDITNTFTNATSSSVAEVVLKNLFNSATDATGNAKHITATDTNMTFLHNGVTWTYTNDGSIIKLTGKVNMYRLTKDADNEYLVYFNQLLSSTQGSSKSYYIPGSSINVTLTVATATSSTTK